MEKPQPILEGKTVAMGYKKGKSIQWISEQLFFKLYGGKLTCLMGPNGVGKSTLIKAILGNEVSRKGVIQYKGKDIRKFSPKTLAKNISVVLTDPPKAAHLTVGQLVALGRTPFTNWLGTLSEEDCKVVNNALEMTKTAYLLKKKIGEISDGQRQKVMIARALAQDGELIILDEPTAHLDLVNRYEIMHLLREIAHTSRKAVLVVTHDLDIALNTADEFWLMPQKGPLIHGLPEDMVLSGQINRLLPDDALHFDRMSGKIQPYEFERYSGIEGPQEVVQWLKLALRKNRLSLRKSMKIIAKSDPIRFIIDDGSTVQTVETIAEVIKSTYINTFSDFKQ